MKNFDVCGCENKFSRKWLSILEIYKKIHEQARNYCKNVKILRKSKLTDTWPKNSRKARLPAFMQPLGDPLKSLLQISQGRIDDGPNQNPRRSVEVTKTLHKLSDPGVSAWALRNLTHSYWIMLKTPYHVLKYLILSGNGILLANISMFGYRSLQIYCTNHITSKVL